MFSYKKILVISASCFVVIVVFGFIAYPFIFKFIIKDQVSLHKQNFIRQFYLKYPIPLDFRIYFFNVTNPLEVHEGGTPILKEIGPYCYDLYKERINVVDNETEDSLTYTPYDNYIFNQERSKDLTQDDYVTIIHPLIVSMVNFVANNFPQFLPIVNVALGFMFKDNKNIYLTAKVRDILFDGMLIDCSAHDFSTMGVCTQLKTKVPGIVQAEDGFLKFSILGHKNGTIPIRLKILRGIKESKDLGRLIAVDNATKTDIWANEECNQYKGTDGWIFPPLSSDEKELWIHSADLCKNIRADFIEDTVSHGISVRKFYSDFGDCDCSTPDTCPLKGILDVTKCVKAPLYVSLPHFLRGDESLLQQVKGLDPVTEKHITRIILEGTLSVPLEAQIRAQFNFPIQPTTRIDIMQTVPKLVHPVLWVEMGVVLDGWILEMIQTFFATLTALEVIKYFILLASLLGVGYGGYLFFKKTNCMFVRAASDTIVLHPKTTD